MSKPSKSTPPSGYRFLRSREIFNLPKGTLYWHPVEEKWKESFSIGTDRSKSNDTYCTPVKKRPRSSATPKVGVAGVIPDTGGRTNFNGGATRDSCIGKGIPSRIPPTFIRRIAKRFEDGKIKYPDKLEGKPNWMQGIPLSRYQDAVMRHTLQAAEGDQSEDHLSAAGWNIGAWMWTQEQIELGDLPAELNDLPFHPVNLGRPTFVKRGSKTNKIKA